MPMPLYHSLSSTQNDKVIYKILLNYFNAFKKNFSHDWGNGDSILTKTTGYNAMMLLFKDLFKLGYNKSNFSEEFFDNYLKCIKHLDKKTGTENYGSSGLKAARELSEKGSIIITTNLEFSRWTELFDNPTMVAALVDRITFRSYVLNMNGDSYRKDGTSK